MRRGAARLALSCVVGLLVQVLLPTSAHADDRGAPADSTTEAVREMLEGADGLRPAWNGAPVLVVLGSVMDYRAVEATARYRATGERLTGREQDELVVDLTEALATLTGGVLTAFAEVRIEPLGEGDTAVLFRRGTIVVGRFRGVRAQAGTIGYGGRTTRDGLITAGAVMLDRDYDRDSDLRHILRTHELGHALGYNHVLSATSIMNPRVGSPVTDVDRQAIQLAFAGSAD